jgi:hypothetical protein
VAQWNWYSIFKGFFETITLLLLLLLLLLLTEIELSIGGGSPYTNTDKTNKH